MLIENIWRNAWKRIQWRKQYKKAVKIPPIAYSYSVTDSLTIKKDIPYCHQNAIAQTFDVYYPKDFHPFQHKIVLFVNGGGPIKQDYKSYPCFTSWGELVAVENIIGITFNCRSGKQEDIIAMIDYLFAHSEELGIHMQKICVFSLCRSVNYTLGCVLRYPEIKKMIMYYGKISTNTELANCANRSFFIAFGALDKKYPSTCNDWFIENAKVNQYAVELCIHPNGVHGFDYANDDEYTREIIEKTLAFIKK